MNLSEFFAMGGYAFYVWTSYGIALVVLALNIIQPLMQQKRTLRAIRRRQQRHRRQVTGQ
ncbi:MAG: heme exporter protein CcmD [Gammaproteobacteria bacterium]